jgi:class 3 adenylate cyclase
MEPNIFNSSNTWRTAHDRRIKAFVNSCSWIVFIISGGWCIYWYSVSVWELLFILLTVMASALSALILVRKQKIQLAARTIIVSGSLYFLTIYMLTTNDGNHTSPFWFIVLAIFSYFVLSHEKNKPVREIVPAALILLSFLTYFKIIPYTGIHRLQESSIRIVSMVDLASSLTIILFITRLFLIEITQAETKLVEYSDRLDSLVDNILPKPIADRLRTEGTTFADYIPECSVMFADISGFTPWSEKQSPTELVNKLNELFSEFDEIVERMGITKIKTIGDAYMVASGIPIYRSDHALSLANFATQLHLIAKRYPEFQFRCGIHSGPVVAGIIGKKSIIYDMWGDTVNTASRLESHGFPGKTMVSEMTYLKLGVHYPNAQSMTMMLKGKGEMKVYVIG